MYQNTYFFGISYEIIIIFSNAFMDTNRFKNFWGGEFKPKKCLQQDTIFRWVMRITQLFAGQTVSPNLHEGPYKYFGSVFVQLTIMQNIIFCTKYYINIIYNLKVFKHKIYITIGNHLSHQYFCQKKCWYFVIMRD